MDKLKAFCIVLNSDLCRASRLLVDLKKCVTALVAANIIVWVVSINEINIVKTGIEQTAETSFMSHIVVTTGAGHCDLDMMKQAPINVILFLYFLWIILQRRKWCSPCSVKIKCEWWIDRDREGGDLSLVCDTTPPFVRRYWKKITATPPPRGRNLNLDLP